MEVLLGFFEIAPVIEPAELLAAVVVGLPRQVVEGIAEDVHVAALPHRLGQQLTDGALQSGMVVRDDELHPCRPRVFRPVTNVFQLERDSRFESSTPSS